MLRVHAPHIGYLTTQFNAAALICHFDNNEEKGRELATAVANFWKFREEKLDEANSKEGRDFWRNNHQLVHNSDLGDNYDLTAMWMNEDQKRLMRRIISKATGRKRGHGAWGPVRWFDTNWDNWDFCHVLNALSIEGEEGYDPEIYENALPRAEAFLTWGINQSGTIFETNGKNGAGFHYQLMTMLAMARRGDNLFGHPHLRQVPVSQAQSIVPQGGINLNNGTWGCASFGNAPELFTFYPNDKRLDWLTRQIWGGQYDLTLEQFAKEFTEGKRNYQRDSDWLLSLASMAGTSLCKAVDWKGFRDSDGNLLPGWKRDQLELPLTFNDPDHGLFTARASNEKEALFMMFEARPDLNHLGHQHHDAGSFYLASHGQMWAVQGNPMDLPSVFNSVPRIDGRGFGDEVYCGAPRVEYLDATDDSILSMASADVKNAWDHEWVGPFHFFWDVPYAKDWELSVETEPQIVRFFKGTQNWKKRIWGGHPKDTNWGPTMRVKGRPVQYAYRSAGIVKGQHSYAVVIDDLKMDDAIHHYEWIMQIPSNVRSLDGQDAIDSVTLVAETAETLAGQSHERVFDADQVPKGTPLLLVVPLGHEEIEYYDKTKNEPQTRDRKIDFAVKQEMYRARRGLKSIKVLSLGKTATEMRFKILLIPYRYGEQMPEITYDRDKRKAIVKWKSQEDHLYFSEEGNRTRIKVERNVNF